MQIQTQKKADKKETPFLYLVPYTNKSIKESKGQILTIICPAEKERHSTHTTVVTQQSSWKVHGYPVIYVNIIDKYLISL